MKASLWLSQITCAARRASSGTAVFQFPRASMAVAFAIVLLASAPAPQRAFAQQVPVGGQAAPAVDPAADALDQDVDQVIVPPVVEAQTLDFGDQGQIEFTVVEATPAELEAARAATGGAAKTAAGIEGIPGNYWIRGTFSAKQNCVFPSNLKMTLQAINSAGGVEKSTVVNSSVGWLGTYSGTWTI